MKENLTIITMPLLSRAVGSYYSDPINNLYHKGLVNFLNVTVPGAAGVVTVTAEAYDASSGLWVGWVSVGGSAAGVASIQKLTDIYSGDATSGMCLPSAFRIKYAVTGNAVTFSASTNLTV